MSLNFRVGARRIALVLSIVGLGIGALGIFAGDFQAGFIVGLVLFALVWVLYFVIRWIFRGFTSNK